MTLSVQQCLKRFLRRSRLALEGMRVLAWKTPLKRTTVCSETVVVIKLDQIGDFLLWLDSAREYRSIYRGKRLILYANHVWARLAENQNIVDEVISIDPVRLQGDKSYRTEVYTCAQSHRAGICIHPVYSRHFSTGDALVRVVAAPVSIGFMGDLSNQTSWQRSIANRWYTDLVQDIPTDRMELIKNAMLARHLGAKSYQAKIARLLIRDEADSVGPGCRINSIVVFPGASWYGKIWPVEAFAESLEVLREQFQLPVVLAGGRAEEDSAKRLVNLLSFEVENLVGKTTVEEMALIVSRASLVLGNDSAGIHIAAALNVPSVCILGGGHYGRFLPYKCESKEQMIAPIVVSHPMSCYQCDWMCRYVFCKKKPFPCISEIGADKVIEACAFVLSSSRR